MKISQKEIESVSRLTSIERYNYFLKRVADFELMYTLIDEQGNLAISEIEHKLMVSFWSAKEYAQINAINEWKNYQIKEFSVEEFENELIDIIETNNYILNIFPINDKTGVVVDLNEFARDLNNEMKKYH